MKYFLFLALVANVQRAEALVNSAWGTRQCSIGRGRVRCSDFNRWRVPTTSNNQFWQRSNSGDVSLLLADSGSSDDKGATESSPPPERSSMSFQEATTELKDEEDLARAERSGGGLSEEQLEKFDAKKTEYDSMREKIRSRAQGLNMEKSEATRKAIEEATSRAMAKEEAQPLDLSAINDETDVDLEDIPDLTDDEREEVETFTKMGIVDKFQEEISNVKWPTLGAAVRLAGFMVVIFVLTSTYILKVDESLRDLYTNWGLIPVPGSKLDYTDLALPEGWENDMDSMGDSVTDLLKQGVDEITDAIQQ